MHVSAGDCAHVIEAIDQLQQFGGVTQRYRIQPDAAHRNRMVMQAKQYVLICMLCD